MEVIFYIIGLVGFLISSAWRAGDADDANGEGDAKPREAGEDQSSGLAIAAIVLGMFDAD